MAQGTIRRLFPGGNTSEGFFSYYDHICPDARRLFVLKGGPGTGKSTFLQRTAADLLAAGLDVELHHCSADPASLDAIVVPAARAALLDGTAPHVVDPRHPGCVDEIVDLGRYWDGPCLRRRREAIMRLSAQARPCFQRAYRYLAAARHVQDDWEAANAAALDQGWLNRQTARVIAAVVGERTVAHRPGRVRRLFASSITPDGPRHHLETLAAPFSRTIVLRGEPGTGKATLLSRVVQAAVECGLDVEAFHCAFRPREVEHVLLPAADTALFTCEPPHEYVPAGAAVIDMETGLDDSLRQAAAAHRHAAQELFRQLMDTAIAALQEAQSVHRAVEAQYIPCMDFDAVEQHRVQIRDQI